MDPDNDCIMFYEKKFKIGPCNAKKKSERLIQPRMSLLGKPLGYQRGSRRDQRYRRLQGRVYNFLERPRGQLTICYHVMVFLLVFLCFMLSVLATVGEYEENASYLLVRMEVLVVIWLAVEYGLRVWSSGCRSRYQGGMGRLKFIRRPFCVIDLITIVATVIVLGMGTSSHVFAASAFRGLRFFQILRMLRMDRRGGTWKLLGSVAYAHRQELMTTTYIAFISLILASFLVYLVEKDANPQFANFAQALWWGVITLCTIGYGDIVPATWQGKLIGAFCTLLGFCVFALPAGILGSGLALKVQQQQRQKHMIRRYQPAAALIQAVWRCYAADEQSSSVATWKIHEVPLQYSPPTRTSSSSKTNAIFVSRFSSIRRHKTHHVDLPLDSTPEKQPTEKTLMYTKPIIRRRSPMEMSDLDEEAGVVQLTEKHKLAIRFIRKLKYFIARRKFKEALKPYDVKDVMEQYATGHVDLLGRVKNVQVRLDQILGKQGRKSSDTLAPKISLAARVVNLDRKVGDIEQKLDIFMKVYMEDRERLFALSIASAAENRRASEGDKTDANTQETSSSLDQLSMAESPGYEAQRIFDDNSSTISSPATALHHNNSMGDLPQKKRVTYLRPLSQQFDFKTSNEIDTHSESNLGDRTAKSDLNTECAAESTDLLDESEDYDDEYEDLQEDDGIDNVGQTDGDSDAENMELLKMSSETLKAPSTTSKKIAPEDIKDPKTLP